jgi:uncharacterized membrane protein YdjX (TVP38/TMEM64 family)
MHSYRSLLLYAAAVVVLAVAYLASPISRETVSQLFPGIEAAAQANPLVTALVFLVVSTVLAFLASPAMPIICITAGSYMDGFGGAATVLFGSALGGLSAFLFYRSHIRHPIVAPLNQPSSRSIWLTLIGLRLSPLVPAPLVNLFAALFDVSPLRYLTTSLLGSAPLVLFYWQIGQQGHQFLSGGTLHWRQFSGYLVILILSTLLSAMGPWRSVLNEFKQLKVLSGTKKLPLQPASRPQS